MKPGVKPKFDYDGQDFYTAIGNLAQRDYDDHEIAQFIGDEIRAIVKKRYEDAVDAAETPDQIPDEPKYDEIPNSLDATVFSDMKNGRYANWSEQENKLRSMLINQVLQHARGQLRIVYKNVYNKVALGKIKTTTKTTQERNTVTKDGTPFTEKTTTTTTQEMPPNLQALTMWRWHHDPEFKKAMTQMKRMDVSVEDKSIDKIKINVVYNKKEDTELQEQKKDADNK